jgi:hypothetical protein
MEIRIRIVAAAAAGIVLIIAVPLSAASQMARAMVEKPKFERLERRDGEEDAMSKGFGALADYIFGNNVSQSKVAMTSPVTQETRASEKVAMTTPVLQESGGTDVAGEVVQFVMPSKYTMETLPKPNNPAVTLAQRRERTYAVLKFSWRGKDEQMHKKEAELRRALVRDGVSVEGNAVYARYDPPWTLPIFRRNEVLLPIEYIENPRTK